MAKTTYGLPTPTRLELMRVIDHTNQMGINYHIYLRNQMICVKELPGIELSEWKQILAAAEKRYEWLPEHRFTWNGLDLANRPVYHYGIHLKAGITIYWSGHSNSVQVISDFESDQEIVNEITELTGTFGKKPKNRVGLIQMSYGSLNVKFVEYRPYELEITPFLCDGIAALKEEMLQAFQNETASGLYLIHGKPGTGKTSFLKEILNEADKQALFIPPSIAGELGNPNLISLLLDHSDSILIIEDAETILMKREADNSDAVSNLLNLTDGFPSDFLKLNIICTFNTDIRDIDPALLRKGRLRGIQEFTKLPPERARKLAEFLGLDIEANGPLSIAEICNAEVNFDPTTAAEVGFVNSNKPVLNNK